LKEGKVALADFVEINKDKLDLREAVRASSFIEAMKNLKLSA